jgi:hypothetical protein
VFGELHGVSGLVLELSRNNDAESSSQEVRANIIARVDQCYDFNGQYEQSLSVIKFEFISVRNNWKI